MLFTCPCDHVVPLKYADVMLHQLVINSKRIGELVDVVRPLRKKVNYPDPILAPSGASKKEPKQALSTGSGIY